MRPVRKHTRAPSLWYENSIIGGTANTFDDVVSHYRAGADYIGCGPFRFTTTKKNLSPILGLVNPWEYGIALAETAVRNGADVKLEFEVTSIEKKDGFWHIESPNGSVDAKFVINAAGVDCDTVHNMVAEPAYTVKPSAGEYYLLDLSEGKRANHVIFQCPDKDGKGVLVTHTCHGNLLVGPNADPRDKDDTSTKSHCLDYIREKAVKSVPSIVFRENIRNFTGVRAVTDRDDFIIEFAAENFLDLAGIKSPGLSAAPAIALEAVKMLGEKG